MPIPVPQPPLGREQLLVAALRAASAFSAGASDQGLQKSLADRKFEFRIRFGCDGPGDAGSDKAFAWTYNEKTRALKVRATPELSAKDSPVKAIAGEAFESVEGFWLRRPWLLAAACPRRPESAVVQAGEESPSPKAAPERTIPAGGGAKSAGPPPVQPPQSVGIAQFFTATGPRTMRRSGRAYEATKKIEIGNAPSEFDLVLTGRLVALPDGRVIACTLSESSEQPSCIISVEFGKVSIERADTHEQLAQWGSG